MSSIKERPIELHRPPSPRCVPIVRKVSRQEVMRYCTILKNSLTPAQAKILDEAMLIGIEEDPEKTNSETEEEVTPIGDPPTKKRCEFMRKLSCRLR